MNFSALVLTKDEELQVEGCLRSLEGAEAIVVVDSGSTDRTLDIISSLPRARIVSRPFVSFADQRNFGLTCFRAGEWVFHLDADERVTPQLVAELGDLEPPQSVVAYNVASRTFLRDRPVLRAAGYPVYQTRLTRAGAFEFESVGHGQKAPARFGSLPRLEHPYDHHPFEKGLAEWRRRHESYADKEAEDIVAPSREWRFREAFGDPIARRQWLKHRTGGLRLRPWLVWLYLILLKRGILDGPAGWEYCRLRRVFEQMVLERVRAKTRGNDGVS